MGRCSYNADGILTGITRSNGINTAFTLDDAAQITGISHGTLASMQYTFDVAGQITGANRTLPLDPATLLQSAANTRSYDGASQVSSTGYAYDEIGRRTAGPSETYTWDNAGRLTGADGTSLTYNGLGNVSGRTEGSHTVNYYYNHAIELQPIVAEREGSGAWLRYYVYTPSGRLLYMIDALNGNAVSFYHFDRVGSTLFLTDAAGAITDSYAYTPYGRLLGHNGNNPQPFTFAGESGVHQEGSSGTLYHMRARYYDAVTGSFLSRESLWPDISHPRMLNAYQYALADPVSHIDPTGAIPLKWAKDAGKELGKEGAKSVVGELLDIPSLPVTPCGVVDRIFEGTPMGLTYGDPQWGYGNAQIGAMTKAQAEAYQISQDRKLLDSIWAQKAAREDAASKKKWKDPKYARKQLEAFIANFGDIENFDGKQALLLRAKMKLRKLNRARVRHQQHSNREATRKFESAVRPFNVSRHGFHYTPQEGNNSWKNDIGWIGSRLGL